MAEIINVYKELIPPVRFIGKCYTHEDGQGCGYGHRWDEWFGNGWFDVLEGLGKIEGIEDGQLGFIRGIPEHGGYWIGMFLPPGTEVPDGFASFDLDEGHVGVCWIKGPENDGSIYGMHEQCLQALREKGMGDFLGGGPEPAFFFERYVCPRFTHADEQGNIILDYGVYLK